MNISILFCGYATVDVIEGKTYPGGAAAVMAINAVQLDISSHLLSGISTDSNGQYISSVLREKNVDLSFSIPCQSGQPTCIITDPFGQGSTRKWSDNGMNTELDATTISVDTQLFDAVFLSNCRPSIGEQIARTSPRNLFYIPGPQIVTNEAILRDEIISKTTGIFCNDEEYPVIMKHDPFAQGVAFVVQTRGSKGGVVDLPNGTKIPFTASKVSTVVDTTGAGDSFALAFAHTLLQTHDITMAIESARAKAAQCVTQMGGIWP